MQSETDARASVTWQPTSCTNAWGRQMRRHDTHVQNIAMVARQLSKSKTEVVFTGGSIVGLLLTDRAADDVRPTDDVDAIVGAASYSKYALLQDELRTLGFKHDMNGPNCRFILR